MILSAIFHFLKKILSYVIKIIAWLLVALSLWVPLLYALLFIIICGITGVSITAVQSWFWGGLALSFVGSFLVSTFIYERRIARKKRTKAEPVLASGIEKVKEKQDETLIKKRDEQPALAEGDTFDSGFGEAHQGTAAADSPASNSAAGGPSLMERLKQGAPELRANDTAGKYNFISYNSVNNQSGNQEDLNKNKGLYGDSNTQNNNQSGFNSQSNFNNQNGFAGGQDNVAGFSGYNPGGGRGYGDQSSRGGYQNNFNGANANTSGLTSSRGDEYRNNPYESFSGGFDRGENAGGFDRPASDTLSRGDYGMDYNSGFGDNFAGQRGGGDTFNDGEKPNVFATRSDPTLLIYEYPDRVEYYKRTRAGLVLFKTRPKDAN